MINITTEKYVEPILVTDLLAVDATLQGNSIKLRNNSNVAGGKDLDYIDIYPNNIASWTISPTTNLSKVEISVTASSDSTTRSICLYLDDTQIVKDLVISSGSWNIPTTVVAKTVNMTAGSHTITVSRGSTDSYAPLVASINIKGWE